MAIATRAPMNEVLRKVPLFAEWPQDELDRVEPGVEMRLEAGDWLAHQGDLEVHFYLLLDGQIRVTQSSGDREIYLLTHLPGAFFGEVPILLKKPSLVSYQALS